MRASLGCRIESSAAAAFPLIPSGLDCGWLTDVDDVPGGYRLLGQVRLDEQAAVGVDAGGLAGHGPAAGELHPDVLAEGGAEVAVLGEQAGPAGVGIGSAAPRAAPHPPPEPP